MFRSLQNKLLAWFLAFSLLSILLIVPFSLYHYSKKEEITNVVREIDHIQIALLKTNKIQNDFFSYETINPDYFRTGKSMYLLEHKNMVDRTSESLDQFAVDVNKEGYGLEKNVAELQSSFKRYIELFDTIVNSIYKRGFKDYGIEGQMRDNIHKLEAFPNISQTNVLSLRRHEKDYIIRNDEVYIDKHRALSVEFAKRISHNPYLSRKEKDSALNFLNNYTSLFSQLIELDNIIGIKDNSGLKMELDQQVKTVEAGINTLIGKANEKKQQLFRRLEVIYLLFSFVLVLLSILVSLLVSKGLITPFTTLSSYLKKLIASDFKKKERIIVSSNSVEIEELYHEFNEMVMHLLQREKEREKAEDDLRESELRFRQLAQLLPICVYEADENDQIYYVNKAFIETFNYSKSDVLKGVNLVHLVTEGDREKLFFKEPVIKNELIAKNKKGEIFPALIYANQMIIDNEVKGSRGVIIDVSDRLLALKQLSKKTKDAIDTGRT